MYRDYDRSPSYQQSFLPLKNSWNSGIRRNRESSQIDCLHQKEGSALACVAIVSVGFFSLFEEFFCRAEIGTLATQARTDPSLFLPFLLLLLLLLLLSFSHGRVPVGLESFRFSLNMCIRVQYQCSVFLCGILDRSFSLHVFEIS